MVFSVARQWQVKQNDKILGPFSDSQMTKLVATGRVHEKTPVRSDENSIWFVAGRFPELFSESDARPEPEIIEYAEFDDSPEITDAWYVGRDGQSLGPFTRQQLSDRVKYSWLRPTDLIWKPDYVEWKPAKSVKGLFPETSRTIPKLDRGRPRRFLSANDFRYPGEATSLLIACCLLLLLIVATTAVSVGVGLVVIAVSVVVIKIQESNMLSRCVPIDPHNDPDLFALAQTASDRLCVRLPPLYIEKNSSWNAYAIGFLGSANVVLHSSLVDDFDRDELLFIIGHELSHLKCNHTNWLAFTNSSTNVLRNIVFQIIADVLFKAWSRKGEFTCDRGGLLACRSPKAAISALAKLELGPDEADERNVKKLLNEIRLAGDSVWNAADDLLDDHPQGAKRIQAIKKFWQSDYKQLIED